MTDFALAIEEMTAAELATLAEAEAAFRASRALLAEPTEETFETQPLAAVSASGYGTGIDISTYQGHPNFVQVKGAGVVLCIMRSGIVSGGRVAIDSVYLANRSDARAAGLPIGNYLFNGAMDAATAASQQFALMDYRPGEPVVIDVEGAAGTVWNPTQVYAWAQRMLSLGVRIQDLGVYMSSSVTRSQNWSAVAGLGLVLWVAAYGSNNGTPGSAPVIGYWSSWIMWQFTSTATCSGIAGRVDTSLIAAGFPVGVNNNHQQEEEMTDSIYYADTKLGKTAVTSKSGVKVVPESMWYQERPGAPLQPLSAGNYAGTPVTSEYAAFLAHQGSNQAAWALPSSTQAIADLIDLRGTAPIGTSESGGGASTVPDPAAWGKAAGDAVAAAVTTALEGIGFTASGGFAPKN